MSKKKIVMLVLTTAFVTIIFTLAGLLTLVGTNTSSAVELARFLGAFYFVESRYVQEVSSTKLVDGAINGMVQALGDPHSIYLDTNMYHNLKDHTEGAFGGIGVYMGFKDHKVTIISVMEGTPGEAAGLKAGDEILAVDSVSVTEIQPEEVAMKIRGEIGTNVNLLVRRAGQDDASYDITRATIEVKSVASKMIDSEMGYIRISSFAERTGAEFVTAYDELKSQGMRGLVLDLRQNPGGLINSCVEVAKKIVPKGLIVYVVERDGSRQDFYSELEETSIPMVVLIDGNSASASEIIAGALQDTGAATIVGRTSYGKGSVQTVLPMAHDGGLKLTIAKYYTPNGRSIDGTGVSPDVEINLPENATEDVQLEKAEEVLKTKLNL